MKNCSKEGVDVISFGCRLNAAESEIIKQNAEKMGLRNVVIVNTCAVTAEAERQAGQAIRRLKKERPDARIIVTGCSSEINPDKYKAMEEVEEIIGNLDKLKYGSNISIKRPEQAEMQRAFIEVQNGCDNRCTFCIIPYGRGKSRSVSFETVSRKMAELAEHGYKEVVITGIDIASYGKDLPGEPALGYMLKRVLKENPGIERVRLSSLDPCGMDEDLWDLIKEEQRFMPHLHLSIQSGDNLILKRMGRRHTREDILRLTKRARKLRPDIVFGADIIAGFPTESEEAFRNSVELVESSGITWLHVFKYSARKGTPAAKMPQVDIGIRKERAKILQDVGKRNTDIYNESLLGKEFKVLAEKNGIGCTPHFGKVKIEGATQQNVGKIVKVRAKGIEKGILIVQNIENI
ncbi:MAG: MiaB/RimO family radical SAM methylthiotransferase [Alphaproteobacteria bacterium]|nr:MiaB/RimO family radical SAM methylthiotransferase [Alphaproteobacteria bacterium]